MKKRLIKHGNSLALIIDKSLLKILNIAEDTPLKMSTDGKSLSIIPVREHEPEVAKVSDNEKIQKAYERVVKKYSEALKKLANR